MGNTFIREYRRVVRNNDFSKANLQNLRTLWDRMSFEKQREVWQELGGVMDQRVINAIT